MQKPFWHRRAIVPLQAKAGEEFLSQSEDKKAAALAAVAEVRGGMRIGLGTGSTAFFAIQEIGRRVAADGLRVEAVATSLASEAQAKALGIPLLPFGSVAALDLAIDGADEIDADLRAIKGAGGAMLREKVVAASARRMIAIVDGSKQVTKLGAAPVPVEVLPFAQAFVTAEVAKLGADPVLRRDGDSIYSTDQGNLILDCRFVVLDDPARIAAALDAIPGLLGHGLFLREIDAAYVSRNGVAELFNRPAAR